MNMGAMEQKGSEARLNSFFGAYSLSDIVKTTLGPKGMDKILQSQGEGGKGKTIITNDGATILTHIMIDNPAAKILVDISKSQDKEVGDGTTTVCVFAGELLRQAESLFQ
jgi:T-complex protein 1 subunit beta